MIKVARTPANKVLPYSQIYILYIHMNAENHTDMFFITMPSESPAHNSLTLHTQ